jgi:hypothetical protein
MRSTRIKWVIALAVAVSGIWFMGVMYVLTYKPDVYVAPGNVGANLPTSAPVMPTINSYTPSRARNIYRPANYGAHRTQRPASVPMQSMRIRTTSSAQVHSIGGGGNGGGGAVSGGSSSHRGIVYSTASVAMPQTNFLALASTRQMAAPEASEAPSMASMASISGMRRAPGPPTPGGGELPDEHQLTEQPVGDAVLPLMMLVMLYCAVRVYRRKSTAND